MAHSPKCHSLHFSWLTSTICHKTNSLRLNNLIDLCSQHYLTVYYHQWPCQKAIHLVLCFAPSQTIELPPGPQKLRMKGLRRLQHEVLELVLPWPRLGWKACQYLWMNAWGRRLVCFNFLAGCELGRLDVLAVCLVPELIWLGVAELLPEGPDNCLKAVAAAVASTEAWTQGPLPPRIWAIKAIFSPLTCLALLQAVAIIRITHLLQNLTNCHQNYSVQLSKLLQGPVHPKSLHWAMPEVDDNWHSLCRKPSCELCFVLVLDEKNSKD